MDEGSNYAKERKKLGNQYWKQCLLMEKNVYQIAENELYVTNNLDQNFTIRILAWGLAND